MLRQDLKQAVRVLRKSPGFTVAALAMLALGIGANTAIFTVVHTVLVKPLPYPEGDRLMYVLHRPPAKSFPGVTEFAVSIANYLDWRAQNHSFEAMSAIQTSVMNMNGTERPESLITGRVEADFFRILRARPILGRTLLDEEDNPGRERVAVISNRLWKDRLGGDPSAVGRHLMLDGQNYTIVGVMPDSFSFHPWQVTKADLWIPLAWDAKSRQIRNNHNYLVIARLKDGVDQQQAQAEMDTISSRLEKAYPEDNSGWGAVVLPLREDLFGDVRTPLLVLLGAVGFVLLIACANIANLLMARNLGRRKEMAIRAALGASRARLVRQALTETVLLSVTGGALGLFVASGVLDIIKTFLVSELPRANELELDPRVLTFTLVLSLLTGIIAGVLPSLKSGRADVNDALKQGLGRTDADSGGGQTKSVLVGVEVALSLVLLAGAGLMVRTLFELRQVDPGLDPRNVITTYLRIPKSKYKEPAGQLRFYEEVLRRVRTLPGVIAAGTVTTLPFNDGGSIQPVVIEGRPAAKFAEQPEVSVRTASAGYVEAMRIPLRKGRLFTEADRDGKQPVVLISEAMAKHFWPGEDPIGKRLTLSFSPERVRQVIGVIGNVKENGLNVREPIETLYEPLAQTPVPNQSLAVRTATPPMQMVHAIGQAVHEVDPEQALTDVETMEERLERTMFQQRFTMVLLSSFAAVALALAVIGIYSVLAYTVKRRMREIGVRVALGAQATDVLRMVVVEGMRPTLLGIAAGLAASVALSRLLDKLVFGVKPWDPVTLTGVCLLLGAVACTACLVPAIRATRVDPIRVLRDE